MPPRRAPGAGLMGRPHVELAHAPAIEPVPLPGAGWPEGATVRVLSTDTETGAFTGVLRLPAGWRRGPGCYASDTEWLVLDGLLRVSGELRGFGWYEFGQAGTDEAPWVAASDVEVLLMPRTAAPDFVPGGGGSRDGRLAIDSDTLPWMVTPIPGPTPGIVLKVLRRDEETGERTWLSASTPRRRYTAYEWHDCVEESYLIAGDIWLGNSGLMLPGSYFWRPPYITHGPFYTRRGRLTLTYCSGPLVNHLVDDPRRTPEENRRDADGLGAPTDYLAR